MTSRAIFSGLFKRGKQIVLSVAKQKTQKAQVKAIRYRVDQVSSNQHFVQFDKLQRIWHMLLPKRYFNSLASQLTRRAAWGGRRNLSLLAFMGLVVAQNRDEEEDVISKRINDFIKTAESLQSPQTQKTKSLSLDHFELGQQIGQGCNAAVYGARLKEEIDEDKTSEVCSSVVEELVTENNSTTDEVDLNDNEDSMSEPDSDITLLSSLDEVDDDNAPTQFVIDDDDSNSFSIVDDVDIAVLSDLDDSLADGENAPTQFTVDDNNWDTDNECDIILLSNIEADIEVGSTQNDEEPLISLSVGDIVRHLRPVDDTNQNAVFDTGEENAKYMSVDSTMSNGQRADEPLQKFDLAVKMMFNYGIESNANAILVEMEREAVPARMLSSQREDSMWKNGNRVRKKSLPPHPNIVEMWGVFVDPVPCLPDCLLNFPAALPTRINPEGIGRNMTMFLVMKRYQYTLKEYLSVVHLSFREKLLLLVQLFEAVDHMGRHGIAHRDMKSDNILLDTSTADSPRLVLSDFGCCLADTENGLQIPFPTDEVDRGGNTALMAPEIINARPGRRSLLDYSKADVWAAGALAYEIFGMDNPFYSSTAGRKLSSTSYREIDLPPLPENVPVSIKNLVTALLARDPNKRPTARQVADVLHILLWTPHDWRIPGNPLPKSEINWWCITMATEIFLEAHRNVLTTTETVLKRLLIQNFNMNSFYKSLNIVQVTDDIA